MDFKLSAEDEAFRLELRNYLRANLSPEQRSNKIDMLQESDDADWNRRLAWHRKMYQAGWVGISWPKEYGGRGATLSQQVIYNEELARAGVPELVNLFGIMMVGPTLIEWGTEEQKKRYIPKILSAEEIWCQGFSEPNAGSDLASLQTRAEEQGDYFIVNGQKLWTSEAHRADLCILLARTDPDAPKHKGISYLLVDMHEPGVSVRPLVQMTGDSGFNEVFFDNVKVPKKNLVGRKNQGWQVALTTLMFERNGTGTYRDMTLLVRELVELAKARGYGTLERAEERQKIAQFACEAAALKYTALRQLTRRLKGLPPGPEGSVLKLCASDLNLRITKFAFELLGPYGQIEYRAPYAPETGKWCYRMLGARALMIAAGTSEIQHNILAERELGLPKD